jgi:hypothetical protein
MIAAKECIMVTKIVEKEITIKDRKNKPNLSNALRVKLNLPVRYWF